MPKKSDLKLGSAVTYTVPDHHQTKTVRAEQETIGSVHHPEMLAFAGIIGRIREEGDADVLIFPPGRDPKWVLGVEQGEEPGQFQAVSA